VSRCWPSCDVRKSVGASWKNMTERDTWCSSLSESCTRQVSGVGGWVRVLHGASALVLLKCACGARVRVCARADARAGVGCGRARERERERVCVCTCVRALSIVHVHCAQHGAVNSCGTMQSRPPRCHKCGHAGKVYCAGHVHVAQDEGGRAHRAQVEHAERGECSPRSAVSEDLS
jgi:hypothetical protein